MAFDNNSNNQDEILQRVEDLKSQKDLEISTLTSKLNVIEAKLATKDEEVRELKTKLLTKDSEVREIKTKLINLETKNSATNLELADLKTKLLLRMLNQTEARTNFVLATPPPAREAQLNELKSKVEEIRGKVLDNKIEIMETKNEVLGVKSNTDAALLRLKVVEDEVWGLGNVSVQTKSEKNVTDQNLLQDLLAEINQLRDQVIVNS